MRILVLSYLFPNVNEPIKGKFVYEQLAALSKKASIVVIAPIPFAPMVRKWRGVPTYERRNNMDIYHPRFLPLPLDRLQWITGIFYSLTAFVFGGLVVRNFQPQVIHSHTTFYDGLPGALLSRAYGRPLVVTAHGSDLRFWTKFMPIRAFTAYTLKRAKKVVSPHPETTVMLAALVSRDKILEIPNGVDTNKYTDEKPPDVSELKQRLGLSDPVVVYVAGLAEFRDPLTFVRAAAIIRREIPNASFVVIGDGPLRQVAQREAELLGVSDRVRFLGIRTDVDRLLHLGPIFTALSPVDNLWCTSLVEAMAAGRACVVTEAGTEIRLHELLSQVVILISPKNPMALAEAVAMLWREPKRRQQVATAARDFACQHFDLEKVASRIMSLYRLVSSSC